MKALKLSEQELDVMDGLPHFHRCVYIFGIRRYMDYKTGITGITREISYKSLAEEVYVKPHQGVAETGNNSRDQVKRALTLLEKKGLIKRRSIVKKEEKILILECLLAERDESVQNKAAPLPPHSPTLQAALVSKNKEKQENVYKNSIKGVVVNPSAEAKSRPASRPTQNEKAARHPVSGIYNNNNNNSDVNFRQFFFDLLKDRSYGMDAMIDPHTGAMLGVWESKQVTTEDVKSGMDYFDAKKGGSPRFPSYYKDYVLNAMRARLEAQDEINSTEVIHVKRNSHKPQETGFQRLCRRLDELEAEQTAADDNGEANAR